MMSKIPWLCIQLTVAQLLFTDLGHALTISCSGDSECTFYIEGSTCKNDTCSCPEGLVLKGDGTACIAEALGYGEACSEDVQCSAALNIGGLCLEDKCTCGPDHHHLKGKCWKNIPLGEACHLDDECYAGYDFTGVSCQEKTCQCRQGYYERGNACRRLSENGEPCLIDSDCNCSGKCTSQKCNCAELTSFSPSSDLYQVQRENINEKGSCSPGFFLVEETCVPELGSDCSTDSEACAVGVKNSECVQNRTCACITIRAGTPNNRACNKAIYQFEKGVCVENSECSLFGNYSICDAGTGTKKLCTCSKETHFIEEDQLCHLSSYVGESCEVDNDCSATDRENIACVENICACKSGSHEAQQDCRKDGKAVGDACIEDLDCLFPNAACNSTTKQCQCSEFYFANEKGGCTAGIGSSCAADTDCEHLGSSSCVDTTCQCQSGNVPSLDSTSCLPVVNVDEACKQTDQCDPQMGDLKQCSNGICGCLDNAQYILGRCYEIKRLGEKCTARAQCIYPGGDKDAYMCQNAICKCQYGYQQSGDVCQ